MSLGHLEITTDLAITGKGSSNTIIDGDGSATNDNVLVFSTGPYTATISGATIQHGNGGDGGGILMTTTGSTPKFLSNAFRLTLYAP